MSSTKRSASVITYHHCQCKCEVDEVGDVVGDSTTRPADARRATAFIWRRTRGSGSRTRSAAVLAALLVELRAWAGAEDAAESERKSLRSENNMASRGTRGQGGDQDTRTHTRRSRSTRWRSKMAGGAGECDAAARTRPPNASGAAHQTGSTWRRAMQRGAGRVGQRHDASAASCRRRGSQPPEAGASLEAGE